MPSAVVRWANTTSGGASMSMDVVYSPIGLLTGRLFGRRLERREVMRPEISEIVLHHLQPGGPHHEEMPGPSTFLGHQTRVTERSKMVGHDLLRHRDCFRDLTY